MNNILIMKFPPTGSHIKFVSETDDDGDIEIQEQKSLLYELSI